MRAIRVHEIGGPDVLRLEDLPTPDPGPGEARIRVDVSGVNFFDIRQRTGDFPTTLPIILGNEGAGSIEAVGPDVDGVRVGDRVAWQMEQGSYATQAVVRADRLVPLPAAIDNRTAGAVLLQGLLAHCLAVTVHPLAAGETILIHAAAGGVGGLLTQIAKLHGVRVIGTVSKAVKADSARAAGADEVIVTDEEDFAAAARRLTDGRGVDVVYDGIGRATFDGGLESLRPLGTMVMYGQASGSVAPIDTHMLQQKGGRFLTRVTVSSHVADHASLLARSRELFDWIERGRVRVRIGDSFPLADAARAQEAMASRQSTGKLLLDIA
jgi:NADPH2:quinone reductase